MLKTILFIAIFCCFVGKLNALTRLETREKFQPKDFIFDLNQKSATKRSGGSIRPLTVSDMPALKDEGISFQLFQLEPCGVNQPHIHPMATEFLYVKYILEKCINKFCN